MKRHWQLEIRSGKVEPDGTEELDESWIRVEAKFTTLEDALKDFTRNRCLWPTVDFKKITATLEDGVVILRGETLLQDGWHTAPVAREKAWREGREEDCMMSVTYGRILFVQEDEMKLDECMQVGRKLGCL